MKPIPIDALVRLCAVTSLLVTSLIAGCSPPQYFTGDPDLVGEATSDIPRGGENSGGRTGKSSGGANATTGGTSAPQSSSTSGSAGSVTGGGVAPTDGGTSSNLGGSTNASSSGGAIAGGASVAPTDGGTSSNLGGSTNASSFGGAVAGGTNATGGNSSTNSGVGGTGSRGGSAAGGTTAAGGSDSGGRLATAAGGPMTAGGTMTAGGPMTAGGGASAGGTTATSTSTGGAATDPDLVIWYQFDDTAGPAVLDSSGNGRNGTLETLGAGTAEYSTMHQVGKGALNLSSQSATVGAYVDMPSSLKAMGVTSALTIATWVQLKANPIAWQRIFDFGVYGAETSYMFLTPMHNRSTPNAPRFAMSTSAKENEQGIVMTTPAVLTTGVWHHFVVVLAATATYTGTLYIDNVVVGTNLAMTLHPSDLGATTENWLGRSQYPADALFNGYLDDFRVYKRALTATEIATIYAVR